MKKREKLTEIDRLKEELDHKNREVKLLNNQINYSKEKLMEKQLFETEKINCDCPCSICAFDPVRHCNQGICMRFTK